MKDFWSSTLDPLPLLLPSLSPWCCKMSVCRQLMTVHLLIPAPACVRASMDGCINEKEALSDGRRSGVCENREDIHLTTYFKRESLGR